MTERVQEIISDILNLPLTELPADRPRDQIASWDSMQNLNIVIALEQEFEISLEPDDFARLQSVASAARLLEEKLASQE